MSKLTNVTSHIIKSVLRVVLYLRLSDEDRDKLSKEELSESIKNQEIMLRNYAIENGWEIVGVYNDEDWSGADSTRPHFNEMIKECKIGNVDIVLCKTQARFARNMELVEKYVHDKFHEWNVRFVTVVDRIDNAKKETKKTSQILGLTDQWYLEDTSNNIRETFKTKRGDGQFTGSFAPYGYMRDPENKNHLIPDPVVSDIVVRIFEEYNKGYGCQKIAKRLTDDKIPSPYEYKLSNGCKLKLPLLRDYIDYKSIVKTGDYIIRISFTNNQKQVIENLTTLELLTEDNINFNNNLKLRLVKLKNDNIRVYYSTKSYEELNITMKNDKPIYQNFNFSNKDNWKLLNLNEVIPKNATCIATNIKEVDNTHEIFYEFEATLKENKQHINYYYKVYPTSNNKDVDLNYTIKIRNKHQWSDRTIKKIITDEVYIGNMVQFKTTTVSYKNHTVIRNRKKDWIRVENTHKALVDLNTWCSAQSRLDIIQRSCKNGKAHVLAAKVFCEDCNRVFCKCGKNDENGFAYLCCKDKATKWSNCDNRKYIKETELQEFVLNKINNILDRFYKEEKQIDINNNMAENDLFKIQIENLNKEKQSVKKELENKDSYFQGLYEDRKKGFIDDNEYLTLRTKYKQDYSNLEERLEKIQKNLTAIYAKQDVLKDKKTLFSKYKHIDTLDINIVNDFIEKIIIGSYDEVINTRNITIIWNFIN